MTVDDHYFKCTRQQSLIRVSTCHKTKESPRHRSSTCAKCEPDFNLEKTDPAEYHAKVLSELKPEPIRPDFSFRELGAARRRRFQQ